MAIFRDLPKDLVDEEILCYIPATYLKRLQSTCKPWNRLFNGGDSRFARQHTDKAAKQLMVLMLKDFRIRPTIVNLHGGSIELKSELSLVDSQSMDSTAQFDIARVFHCDGLLLCTSEDATRFVVWNPFTGETRWFQGSSNRGVRSSLAEFVLGYYQEDKKKKKKSYKVLSFSYDRRDAEIYEFSSDSWRILDAIMAPGWSLEDAYRNVSLKGNTYWLARDPQRNLSLLKFDFQTEKYVPVSLPYQCTSSFGSRGLSVVGEEEKLSVLLQHDTSKTEICVTNKIDEITTQVVSWTKVLALDLCFDLQIWGDLIFLLDEEKKVAMMSVDWVDSETGTETEGKHMIYTVGEDGEVTQVELGPIKEDDECWRQFFKYAPSLVQIEQAGGKSKRKRCDLQIEQAGGKRKRGDLSNM